MYACIVETCSRFFGFSGSSGRRVFCGTGFPFRPTMAIHACIYIYIYAHGPPPPMIHPNLLFVSSGSWEVGNLRCENIDRDQIPPKFLKRENTGRDQISQNSQNLSNYGSRTSHRCPHFGLQKLWGNLSLAAFSQHRMRKHRLGSNFPKLLKPEMRKHWQGSNFPKIPKS